jgi:hypothetical protein
VQTLNPLLLVDGIRFVIATKQKLEMTEQ